ncbi:MAG: amino acid permease [Candidatus Latescibacteria bacterium]|nr:amino acid permease [Candidatus Latescibacterota bacterium]
MSESKDCSELRPELGVADAILLIIGTIIGAGIFVTPGYVTQTLGDEGLVLAAWVLGGVVALAGALSYAELGAAWPRVGGHYVYMRLAYGLFCGFLDGWAALLVNFPGSIAALALAASGYLGAIVPGIDGDGYTGKLVAVALILGLSLVNYWGVRTSARLQNTVTLLKMSALLALIIAGLFWTAPEATSVTKPPFKFSSTAMGGAMIAVMFTYFGWDSATYIASEVRRPSRTLPVAALLGTLAVVAIYVAINVVFLKAVPVGSTGGAGIVADQVARAIFGPWASKVVTAVAVVSILGGLNAMILTGPRISYAMAKDSLFFRFAGKVNTKHQTPGPAIWLQAALAVVLALTGTVEQLFTAAGFVITLLAGATAVAVLVLRRSHPDVDRPYRTLGAPVTPLLFAAAAAWIGVSSVVENPVPSLAGLATIAISWPIYKLWRRTSRK